MNALIIYCSTHQGNTEKIALAIASATGWKTMNFKEMPDKFDMAAYDVVGIGSGVYGGSFNRKLVKYINNLTPSVDKQKCFIFSTAGTASSSVRAQAKIVKILTTKNRDVIGKWSCLGLDKFFVLKLFGGVNKGHPNQDDFNNLNNWIEHALKVI